MNVVDRIVSVQEASNVKYFKLEEKRMQFEERLLEQEECEKERREFLKYMLGMLMQGIHPPMQGPQLLPNMSTSFQSNQYYGNPQRNYYAPPYDQVDEDYIGILYKCNLYW